MLLQLLAVLGEADDVRPHLVERAVGEDHAVGRQVRAAHERDAAQRVLVGVAAEGDDLAAQHAERQRQLAHLGEQRGRHLGRRRQQLEPRLACVLRVGGALQHGDRRAVVREQVQAEGDGGPVGVGPGREVEPVDLPLPEAAPLGLGHEVAQRAVVPLVAAADPEQPAAGVAARDLGEGEVDVDDSGGRRSTPGRRAGRRPAARSGHRAPGAWACRAARRARPSAAASPAVRARSGARRPAGPPCPSCGRA